MAMPGANCARCRRSISLGDTVESDGLGVVHVNCRNPRSPTAEELVFLYVYCWDHAVAQCPTCGQSFRQHDRASESLDVYTYRTYRCSSCDADLTESIRGHLRNCTELPEQLRRKVQGGTRGHPATCQAGSAARRPRRRLAARDRSGPRQPPRNEKTSASNARAVKDSVRGRAHPLDVRSAHFTAMAMTSRSCTPQE
jgi:hypothetical protein